MEYIKITEVIFAVFAILFFFIAIFSKKYSRTKPIAYFLSTLFYLVTGVVDILFLAKYGWGIFCILLGIWIYLDDFLKTSKEYLIYGDDEEVEIN